MCASSRIAHFFAAVSEISASEGTRASLVVSKNHDKIPGASSSLNVLLSSMKCPA
jgi:hypothetical protein